MIIDSFIGDFVDRVMEIRCTYHASIVGKKCRQVLIEPRLTRLEAGIYLYVSKLEAPRVA